MSSFAFNWYLVSQGLAAPYSAHCACLSAPWTVTQLAVLHKGSFKSTPGGPCGHQPLRLGPLEAGSDGGPFKHREEGKTTEDPRHSYHAAI